MSTLKGKVALVTGGSRGIGAAIVRKLAQEGANVAFTYISSAEKANAIVTDLEKSGSKALAIQADSGNPIAVADAVNQTVSVFGKLDILVNNAGVFVMGPLDQADELADQYNRQVDINVHAIPAVVRAASKVLCCFRNFRHSHTYRIQCYKGCRSRIWQRLCLGPGSQEYNS